MPDLLKLASQAKESPESYKSDVISQQQTLKARIQLFRMQPGQNDEEMLDLIHFLTNMCKIYPQELNTVPQQIFELLSQHSNEMNPEFRLELLKNIGHLLNKQLLKSNNEVSTSLCTLLGLHDKKLRQLVQKILLKLLKTQQNDNSLLNNIILFVMSESSSILLKQKLLEILYELFYTSSLKQDTQFRKVVNLFADQLIATPDKRIAQKCLHFLLGEEDRNNDEEPENLADDDDLEKAVKSDELSKLYNQLRNTMRAYKIDEVKRRRTVEKLQSQIRRLKFGGGKRINRRLNTLDYLRTPLTFVEKLTAKFLQKSCSFDVRLQIFKLISSVVELYKLQTIQLFSHFSKYLRPSQVDVSQLLECLIRMVNANQDQSEIKQTVSQLHFNFVHAGASDDEMVMGLNTIAEICRRTPGCLLDDDDGVSLLNELLSYSTNKLVLGAHETKQSNNKTSASTRKGVVMASRRIMNLYRNVAPGYLQKKYLDKDTSMMLQNLEKFQKNTKFVKNVEDTEPLQRIQNIQMLEDGQPQVEEEEESESEQRMSKHQKKKLMRTKSKLMRRLISAREGRSELSENYIAEIQMYLNKTVDEKGNSILCEDIEDAEEYEEDDEYDLTSDSDWDEVDVADTTATAKIDKLASQKFLDYQEEVSEQESVDEDAIDPRIPLEQQRCLTQEEVMKLKKYKKEHSHEINLDMFMSRKKMTAEEKRKHSRESKDRENNHKSNFWNRKDTTRKSRTNKEKLKDKAISMTVHSEKVRRKAGRTRYEKELVRRQHAYNSKRGIDKKISKV